MKLKVLKIKKRLKYWIIFKNFWRNCANLDIVSKNSNFYIIINNYFYIINITIVEIIIFKYQIKMGILAFYT